VIGSEATDSLQGKAGKVMKKMQREDTRLCDAFQREVSKLPKTEKGS
jgi:hypothetical protein